MSGVLTLTHPDLVPVMVQGPPDGVAESNSQIEVRWQVRNDGTAATLGGWTDTVWLSRDGVVSNDDIKLGELLAEAALAAGGVYDGVLTVTLPISADGEYRSEEHTSELQSLMRISYAVFCLQKKNRIQPSKTN